MVKFTLILQGLIQHKGVDTTININNIINQFHLFSYIIISTWQSQDTSKIINKPNVIIIKTPDFDNINYAATYRNNHIRRFRTYKAGLDFLLQNYSNKYQITFISRTDVYYNFDLLFQYFKNKDQKDDLYKSIHQKNYIYTTSLTHLYPYTITDFMLCGTFTDLYDYTTANLLFSNQEPNKGFYITITKDPNHICNSGTKKVCSADKQRIMESDCENLLKYYLYKLYFKKTNPSFKLHQFFPYVYKYVQKITQLTNYHGTYSSHNYLDLWEYIFKHSIRTLPTSFFRTRKWFKNTICRNIEYGSIKSSSDISTKNTNSSNSNVTNLNSCWSLNSDDNNKGSVIISDKNLNSISDPIKKKPKTGQGIYIQVPHELYTLKWHNIVYSLDTPLNHLLLTSKKTPIKYCFDLNGCNNFKANYKTILENSILKQIDNKLWEQLISDYLPSLQIKIQNENINEIYQEEKNDKIIYHNILTY